MRIPTQPDRVELTLPLFSLLQPETLDELKRQFGAAVESLDPDELQALAIAKEEGLVSNPRMQSCLTKHPTDIGRMLKGLVLGGMLISDDRRRWTTYRLTGRALDAGVRQASLIDASGGVPNSEHKGADSEHKRGGSEHKGTDSEHRRGDSEHKAASLPLELVQLAAAVRGRERVVPDLMRRTILDLCRDRFLSAEDLGQLLDRHPSGLRQRFLKPLVDEGRLRLRHPGSSNRPDQAYSATDAPTAS